MSTLDLPSWFAVAECEPTLVPEVRGFPGPYGGPTEVQDLLGDRWRLRLTLPEGDMAQGAKSEALFNRLRGGADWLRLYHFARPVPRGTARGSITLSAGAAQGASSLALAGLTHERNLIPGSSFEIDTNADGLADGWTSYSAGSVSGLATARDTLAPEHGTYEQGVQADFAATGDAHVAGIERLVTGVVAGTSYYVSAQVRGDSSATAEIVLEWRNAGASIISTVVAATHALGGAAVRIGSALTAPALAVSATVQLRFYRTSGSGVRDVRWDAVKLDPTGTGSDWPGLPTLLAGDMLGHNSEQLFQVYEDATATDAGAVTVSTVNRARKAIASAQTIVWSYPTLPFQLLDAGGVPTRYRAGRAAGQTVDFIEAWAS